MATVVVQVAESLRDADVPGVPDAVLAVRAAQGDREAFAGLMVRHGSDVQRLCRRLVGNSPLAEDCAQDAWLLALLRLHRLRSPEHVGAWLRGIAIRVCRRALRRLGAQPQLASLDVHDLQVAGESGPEESAVVDAELARNLRRAVGELPAGQREAVRLFYFHGLTYEEAADALGIATGAIKTRLHKARAALRQWFRLDDVTPSGTAGGEASWLRPHAAAVHEAGHGVVHWLYGGAVSHISIAPVSGVQVAGRAGGGGWSMTGGPEMPVRDVLQTLLAGEAATLVQGGRVPAAWSASDRAQAASLARRLTGGDPVEAALIVQSAWSAARDRLAESRAWQRVQRVAETLVERERLDRDEFQKVVVR